ncbi:MAG: glycosyltransferase [SAR324 cluster bacterium]|nr:glycosyltransferase [SAR324 cluster bacterium]
MLLRKASPKVNRKIMETTRRVGITFARFPKIGTVKTRLCNPDYSNPALSTHQALDIYIALLKDLMLRLETLHHVDWFVLVGGTDKQGLSNFKEMFGLQRVHCELIPEISGDIGNLMEQCFEMFHLRGYNSLVLTGSDTPFLSVNHIDAAFAQLEHNQMVLGPDKGGGIYLAGYQQPLGLMKHGITWSQGVDFTQICDRCKHAGISYQTLPVEIDIDTTSDLKAIVNKIESCPLLKKEIPSLWNSIEALFADGIMLEQ